MLAHNSTKKPRKRKSQKKAVKIGKRSPNRKTSRKAPRTPPTSSRSKVERNPRKGSVAISRRTAGEFDTIQDMDSLSAFLQHFYHPHGRVANGYGAEFRIVSSKVCGDLLRIAVDLLEDTDVIEQIRWDAQNTCMTCEVGASLAAQHFPGKRICEVLRTTDEEFLDLFDEKIPKGKRPCALLALWGIQFILKEREGS